jgi:hypothetical protein
MKRALAGVLAIVFVGLMAAGATAQVPFFQVYFDDDSNGSYGETQANCGPVNSFQNLYLVCLNWNMFVAAVDYRVVLPASGALLFVSDTFPTVPGGYITISAVPGGNSTDGMAVSYGLPRSGFSPMLVTTMSTLWTGACNCAQGPQPLVVGAYPGTGKTTPSGVRWPDYVEFQAVGMTSLLCPGPVSTETKTWGAVKALYR